MKYPKGNIAIEELFEFLFEENTFKDPENA